MLVTELMALHVYCPAFSFRTVTSSIGLFFDNDFWLNNQSYWLVGQESAEHFRVTLTLEPITAESGPLIDISRGPSVQEGVIEELH